MFIKKILLIAILSLISISSYVEQAKVKYEFLQALAQVGKDSNNFETTTINGYTGHKFLYTQETVEQFGNFGEIQSEPNGYISLAKPGEIPRFGYQCVGFVKAVSNLKYTSTGDWEVNLGITPFTMPNKGDIIATFLNNGDYYGHVAIVISVHSDGVYVIDQNSDGTGDVPVGKVYIRKIIFDNSVSRTKNLYKYSTVKI
jgi:hypothetical protein